MAQNISIDIGTTNLKMSLFDEDYKQIDAIHYSYQDLVIDTIKYELNLKEILDAVKDGLNLLINKYQITDLEIFLTTAMHSIQLLNSDMSLIGHTITWADRRGADLVLERSEIERNLQYTTTGTPNHSMNPFYKLLALKEQLPAHKIGSIKDILFYYLTGQWFIDVASASSSGLYSLKEFTWDNILLTELNITMNQLPEIELPTYAADLCLDLSDLLQQAKVYLGTSDGVSSNYAFANLTNAAVLSLGTSHAVRVVTEQAKTDEKTQNFCYQIDANHFLIGYPSNNGANVLRWISEIFNISLEAINEIIEARPAIEGIFFPFINGERSPIWDDYITASFSNIQRESNRESVIYTMVCGMVFNIRQNIELLHRKHAFNRIGIVGGAIKQRALIQLIADALNMQVDVPTTLQAETLGTINLVKNIQIETNYEQNQPNIKQITILDKYFREYKNQLYKYLN